MNYAGKLICVAVGCFFVGGFGFAHVALAGGGPENVMLIVNQDSPTSMAIANHYVALRRIPASNVVYLSSLPDSRAMRVELFRERILQPVVATIHERGLQNQIEYIVYSSGFPTMVNIAADFESIRDQIPEVNRAVFQPVVSLTAATYFLGQVLAEQPHYIGMDSNWYYRGSAQRMLEQPFSGEVQAEFERGVQAYRQRDYARAIEMWRPLAEANPQQFAVSYWLARAEAQQGNVESSVQWLGRAVAAGWCYRSYTETDGAFQRIAEEPAFTRTVRVIPEERFAATPTMAFSGRAWIGPGGLRNQDPSSGQRFFLSTVLSVEGERGLTESEAIAYLMRSVAADGTRPSGTFYFSDTSDVRSRSRVAAARRAAEELRRMGYRAELLNTHEPQRRNDVLGASLGRAVIDWPGSGSRMVPGAIVENFTSFGGIFRAGIGQTALTEFLRHGAAGSSGTVVEPYSLPPKFPDPRIHVHYVRGCSLAEAFYQSVAAPFHLLVAGDALCQPWAQRPRFALHGIQQEQTVGDRMSLEVRPLPDSPAISAIELIYNGRLVARLPPDGQMDVNTANWPDGWHELRVVAVGQLPIETRAAAIVGLNVDRHGHGLKLSADKQRYLLGDEITLTLDEPAGHPVDIQHNGRTVGTIDEGEIRIAARDLGAGPVRLFARKQVQGQMVHSPPLDLTIESHTR